jgi:Fic family protein
MQRLICVCDEQAVYSLQNIQRMNLYLYQNKDWPNFTWSNDALINLLGEARNLQGRLLGRMESLGFDLRNEAVLDTLALDVIKSAEIEGEILNPDQVRSSIAQRLGMERADSMASDRNVDGMVEMMIDWHAGLFPTGRSGIFKITVAHWRKDKTGPMLVVSGAEGREKIHFQAPDAECIEKEMAVFLNWFNTNDQTDLVIKAAVAHLWFVTIHPFQDGNERITRAISDMLLARSDGSNQRFYSLSAQIRIERKQYYKILEKTQKGDLDITAWIQWFLQCLINALRSTEQILTNVLFKDNFWNQQAKTTMNERQKKVISKLLDGFDGKLTSMKWAKMAKCSKDTAIRDINDLIEKGVLHKEAAGGRSTHYGLN